MTNSTATPHTHTVLPADKLAWLRCHLVASHRYSSNHVLGEFTEEELSQLHQMEHGGQEMIDDA